MFPALPSSENPSLAGLLNDSAAAQSAADRKKKKKKDVAPGELPDALTEASHDSVPGDV